MALETGKALRTESRVEASVPRRRVRFLRRARLRAQGRDVSPSTPKMLTLTLRQPLGVVGAIIPWNVPLLLMALKIAPALVAGNSVVVKTAEEAPLAALRAGADHEPDPAARVSFNLLTGYGPECGGPARSTQGRGARSPSRSLSRPAGSSTRRPP